MALAAGQPMMSGGLPSVINSAVHGASAPGTSSMQAPGTYYAPNPEYAGAAENYAQAQNAYNNALIRLNAQRQGVLRQYGYTGDIDKSNGQIKNVHVDTGNSFGQLQELLHNAALEDESAANSAEDRGLVGGLANQGEAEAHYQHESQLGDLASALQSTLSGYDDQQFQSKEALDNALYELTHTAAQTAIGTGEFSPAGTGTPSGDGSNPKAKTVAQKVAAASEAAFKAAGGKSSPAAALAARSAGLNALYGLGTKRAAPKPKHRAIPNAYTSGRKKRG